MATGIVIPTQARPFYSLRTTLDGNGYTLHFRWGTREERWFLSIHDGEDQPILQSIKLLTNWPLAQYQKAKGLPAGVLIVTTASQDTSPPGLEELGIGRRCELTYYPEAIA